MNKAFFILCMGVATLPATGCTSSPEQVRPVMHAQTMLQFDPAKFAQIIPGKTTQAEVEAMFGVPSTSMALLEGEVMLMWTSRREVVSAVFHNGKFAKLTGLTGVYLSTAERARLGL